MGEQATSSKSFFDFVISVARRFFYECTDRNYFVFKQPEPMNRRKKTIKVIKI